MEWRLVWLLLDKNEEVLKRDLILTIIMKYYAPANQIGYSKCIWLMVLIILLQQW